MARRATGRVEGLAFNADGTVLATASDDGSVGVWDVPAGSLRRTLEGHAGAANGPLFGPDGTTLYSGSSDGGVIVWDVRGRRRLGRPFRFAPVAAAGDGPDTSAQDAARAVAVAPDGSLFATSPGRGRVTLWRASDQAVLGELRGPLTVVDSLVFSHDGRLLVATGDARATVVWNVETGKVVRVIGTAGPGELGRGPLARRSSSRDGGRGRASAGVRPANGSPGRQRADRQLVAGSHVQPGREAARGGWPRGGDRALEHAPAPSSAGCATRLRW